MEMTEGKKMTQAEKKARLDFLEAMTAAQKLGVSV